MEKQSREKNIIYVCGSGSQGLLFDDIEKDFNQLTKKKVDLGEREMKKIKGGGKYGHIIDENNDLYIYGEMGEGKDKKLIQRPIKLNVQVNKMSCGWDCSLFSLKGEKEVLMGMGSNQYGQLGLGIANKKNVYLQPIQILNTDFKISIVKAGFRNSFLMGTGSNKYNEMNDKLDKIMHYNWIDISECIKNVMSEDEEIKRIKTGQKFIVYLSSKGNVYGSGSNQYGQLGGGKDEKIIKMRRIFENAKQLQTGWMHTILLTKSMQLMGTGRNNFGQMGNENDYENQFGFKQIQWNVDETTRIKVGTEHNLLLQQGQLYSWGWNEHGNLALQNHLNTNIISKVLMPITSHHLTIKAYAATTYLIPLSTLFA